eukprot:2754890-Rhodomonas_salina.1
MMPLPACLPNVFADMDVPVRSATCPGSWCSMHGTEIAHGGTSLKSSSSLNEWDTFLHLPPSLPLLPSLLLCLSYRPSILPAVLVCRITGIDREELTMSVDPG